MITLRQFASVTPRLLAREFKSGLTMVGLARKYALGRGEVEKWIQQEMIRTAKRTR